MTEARNTAAAIGHGPQLKTNTKTRMHMQTAKRNLMAVQGANIGAIKTGIASGLGIGTAIETAKNAGNVIVTTTMTTSDLAIRIRTASVDGIANLKRTSAVTMTISIVLHAAAGKTATASDRLDMRSGIVRSVTT
tara:strand:+ start:6313 stop:6717 length:405 start_codon:yes stop_codon:yes gene_type:complete